MNLDKLEQEFDMYANLLGLIAGAVGIVYLGAQFNSKVLLWDGFIMFELFFLLLMFKFFKRVLSKPQLKEQKAIKQEKMQ